MHFSAILDRIIGTKTSHHGLNNVGYRRATYAFYKEKLYCKMELIFKTGNNYSRIVVCNSTT